MKIIHNIKDFKNYNKIHLAIGNFDGVHDGHKAVIKNAISEAKKNNSEAWVLTFNPHPLEIINPKIKPNRISTLDQQLTIFKSLDINGVIIMKFNVDLMNLSPINFLNLLANNISKLSGIYVGDDWSFGKNKSGGQTLLKTYCLEKKINLSFQKAIFFQEEKISSSRIRKLIYKGEIKQANIMLGYNFRISGLVIHGKKIGRTLGYPTANIKTENECIPSNGIYAGICYLNNKPFYIALYIGTNETIDDSNKTTIEAHFINEKNLNLYGKIIEIEIIEFLRKDMKFENTKDLQKQINNDISKIKKYLDDLI